MQLSRLLTTMALGTILAAPALPQIIQSVAGNTTWGLIYNVKVDAAGNIYAASQTTHQVFRTDPLGATTVIAGTGVAGFTGDGGLATAARLNGPLDVAIAPDGSIFIADGNNDRIRKIAPNGIITTIAGVSPGGFAGDGGPATAARINFPVSLALDSAGNLFFTDSNNFRVRKITPAGIISTVAGSGRISLSGDGGLATAADAAPCWLAIGPDGSIYFTDDGDARFFGNARVRRVAPNGIITTVAGTGVDGYSGDGGPATAAQLRNVGGVAVDSGGNIYISDTGNQRIRRVDTSGIIRTYAGTGTAGNTGDGGPAIEARLNFPFGLTFDSNGNLYVADRNNNRVRRISPPPVPSVRTANPVLTSFGGNAGFSSNTYVEIYGLNFASTSRLWGGSDFNGANAPTSLDGVSVMVNNRPAYVYFISPTQININTPEDTATGLIPIQVRTSQGQSNVVMVNRARLSPTFQTVPQFNVGGRQHVVALTPDFSTFIGNPGMLQGVNFIRAKPGDNIAIYALGCGPTSPPTQAGVVAAQGSALALPFEVRIGGVPAPVSFAGIVGGTIGLYQFNLTIPSVGPGDQPITLTVDGVPNNQNLVIAIGE